jgi:hypothetical protein
MQDILDGVSVFVETEEALGILIKIALAQQ